MQKKVKTYLFNTKLSTEAGALLDAIAGKCAGGFERPNKTRALEIIIREAAAARGIEAAPDGPPIDQADDAPSK